jgi:hypothetical protein
VKGDEPLSSSIRNADALTDVALVWLSQSALPSCLHFPSCYLAAPGSQICLTVIQDVFVLFSGFIFVFKMGLFA